VSDPRSGQGVPAGHGGSSQEDARSRDLAAEALAGLGNLVVLLDPRGRIVLFNRECERVTGCPAAAAVGRPLWDLFADAEDATPFQALFNHLAPELFPWPCECRLRPPEGEPRLISWIFTAVEEEGGIAHVAGAGADVTERRWAEEDLLRSHQTLRTLIDASPLAISVLDQQGIVRAWNPAAELVYGWSRREVLGRPLPNIPEDRREELRSELRRTFAGESLDGVETVRLRKDGSPVAVQIWTALLRSPQDEPESILVMTADIGVRKRAEAALLTAKEAVEAASRAKDHFLAVLSHELRTPLSPVLAAVSVLEEDSTLRPALRDTLAMIRRNIELEARLIDDLLDLTRVARGKLVLHRQALDARQILVHAVDICCAQEVASGRLLVETSMAPGDYRASADGSRLTQVFWNLLNNAVKFTPAGGTIRVRCRVESGHAGRWIEVEVSDTGIGIEPEILPRVFDAFEQVDRRITRRFGGLGLGLAVSKAIVEMHGGSLAAASQGHGRGATFTVRFPAGELADLDDTMVIGSGDRRARNEARAPRADQPLRILLVEDHADTAEAMAELLRGQGHQVTVAGSVSQGLEAAEALGGEEIDLLLSDLGLPDGSGLDLMRELARRYGIRGIALSGYGMEEDIRKSMEAGFEKHLIKPVSLQALRAALQELAASGIASK
jgi:two-component system, chemotaxis family, CheB/CheR fusion protein